MRYLQKIVSFIKIESFFLILYPIFLLSHALHTFSLYLSNLTNFFSLLTYFINFSIKLVWYTNETIFCGRREYKYYVNQCQMLPNIKLSKLEFWTNSYTSNFSIPSKAKPKSLTKFLCWSLANKRTSFLNSMFPCPESLDNLFTAISWPFGNFPWNYDTTNYLSLDNIT